MRHLASLVALSEPDQLTLPHDAQPDPKKPFTILNLPTAPKTGVTPRWVGFGGVIHSRTKHYYGEYQERGLVMEDWRGSC